MIFRINVRDTASRAIAALHAKLVPGRRRSLMLVMGRQLEGDLRRHFTARGGGGSEKKSEINHEKGLQSV